MIGDMIGDRIRKRRNDLGLSGIELANLVGISQPYISAIEREIRQPSLDILLLLARALGTSVSYLLGETDDPEFSRILAMRKRPPNLDAFRAAPLGNVLWIRAIDGSFLVSKEFDEVSDKKWPVSYHYPIVDKTLGLHHDPTSLFMTAVEGNGMAPDIVEGEQVVFDRHMPWKTGNVIVFRYNGTLMLRGVVQQNERVMLRARNWQEYKDIEVTEEDKFSIIGVVLRIVPPVRKPKDIF
ncbi:MAG: helix-turn-helix domain-containing protein [Synergistaceae bacterium]|jgi:transcriptional regulator with XRE-family HTH domain|nr:helix-turn-helix domain-containing protein [Synergistaceae bacterium]